MVSAAEPGALNPGPAHDSVSRRSVYPRLRGADLKQIARDVEKTPLPPHARG